MHPTTREVPPVVRVGVTTREYPTSFNPADDSNYTVDHESRRLFYRPDRLFLKTLSELAGVSFAIVRRNECGFKGYLREKTMLPCADPARRWFDGMPFDEYTVRWADELQRIAASFIQGDAAVDPKIPPGKSGSPCEYCHLASLCRIGELAMDEEDGESEGADDE